MVEVTEADRLAAAQLIENYWHGDPSKAGNGMRRLAQSYRDGHTQGVWAAAFATHRLEAAKAERDRIVALLRSEQEGRTSDNCAAYFVRLVEESKP